MHKIFTVNTFNDNIIKIDHREMAAAAAIHQVMQDAYTIEAELLGVDDFPPLQRAVEYVQHSRSTFYGCFKQTELTAVIEITCDAEVLEIHSLVVSPNYFRQGLASQLLDCVLANQQWQSALVETGLDNQPAIKLYQKKGFEVVKEWRAAAGIMKIVLQKLR